MTFYCRRILHRLAPFRKENKCLDIAQSFSLRHKKKKKNDLCKSARVSKTNTREQRFYEKATEESENDLPQ